MNESATQFTAHRVTYSADIKSLCLVIDVQCLSLKLTILSCTVPPKNNNSIINYDETILNPDSFIKCHTLNATLKPREWSFSLKAHHCRQWVYVPQRHLPLFERSVSYYVQLFRFLLIRFSSSRIHIPGKMYRRLSLPVANLMANKKTTLLRST